MKDDPVKWISRHFAEAQRLAPDATWDDVTRLSLDLAYEADPDAFGRHLDALLEIVVGSIDGKAEPSDPAEPVEDQLIAEPVDDELADEIDETDESGASEPVDRVGDADGAEPVGETEFLRRLERASVTPLGQLRGR